MSTVTVNVSFPRPLLKAMDSVAKREARSRSGLLRQAVRMYVERKTRWERLTAFWQQEARRAGLRPDDVPGLIAEARRHRTTRS